MIEINEILRAVRVHLGLDIAFVGRFADGRRIFQHVDAVDPDGPVREGDSGALDGSYCHLVATGQLPALMTDAADNPVARRLPVTRELPVGAHISVPIVLSDGSLFGTFCCFGHSPAPSLSERDVTMLRIFADVTARRIERDMLPEKLSAAKAQRIRSLIVAGGPSMVYQPLFDLQTGECTGAEALSRFPWGGDRPANIWFSEAAEVGLQVELELAAVQNALRDFRAIWTRHDVHLGLNASAATIRDERLWRALEGCPRERIVIELTEHEEVKDYAGLVEPVNRLRAGGTKLAIDDVGAGHASMRHVLMTRPDILKLDVGLVRSINDDELKVALISSLKHFSDQSGSYLVAEGIETAEELAKLKGLRIQAGQGYLLGRPETVEAFLHRLDREIPTTEAVSHGRRETRGSVQSRVGRIV